jgi:hypothetical protein
MTSWKLPFIIAAMVVPIVGGFAINGGAGVAVGSIVVVVLVLWAVRQKPRGRIAPPQADDARRHVLFVVMTSVEEPAVVAELIKAGRLTVAGDGGVGDPDVMVLAPARIGFLDRWASDVEPARRAAQDRLVATVAALAKAGIKAEARVGDEDVLQAVEDQLQTYPATDVVLVTGNDEDERQEAAIDELETRLAPPLRRVALGR